MLTQATLILATLTVSFTAGNDPTEDVLGIRNEGTGAGQIGVSGSNVTFGGVIIGTWTGGSSGSNLVITLKCQCEHTTNTTALINNLTYNNTDTDNPTTTTRHIRVVLTDGDGGTSQHHNSTTMTVATVNDAPVLDNTGIDDIDHDHGRSDQQYGPNGGIDHCFSWRRSHYRC